MAIIPEPSYVAAEAEFAQQAALERTPRRAVRTVIDNCCAGNATMATDILFNDYVIVPNEELPTIEISPSGNALALLPALGKFQMLPVPGCSTEEAVERTRQIGLAYLAYAKHLGSEDARRTRELRRRRDDIAFELVNERTRKEGEVAASYDDLIPVVKRAVDRIIEAEDAR